MHIKNVIIVANTLFFITCGAMAALTTGSGTQADPVKWEHTACSSTGNSQTVFFYDNNKYIQYSHCHSCPSGTTQTTSTVCTNPTTTVTTCTLAGGGGAVINPDIVVNCSLRTDSECDSCTDTDWAAVGTTQALSRYLKRTVSTCTYDTDCKCEYSTEYRCAANYYGSSVSCSVKQSGITCSGCTKCPDQDGLIGYAEAGTTTITGCYLMPGLLATTSDGDKYRLNQICHYSDN